MSSNSEYKSFFTDLDIRAQSKFGRLASPNFVTTVLAQRLARRRDPKMIETFIRKYGIDYTDADRCSKSNSALTCAQKYGTLNDFFTRRIKSVRIDPDAMLVSPATCKAVTFDSFKDSALWVKGKRWSVERLVRRGDVGALSNYAVGIFRLRPADYHNFHAPCDARVVSVAHHTGRYLSVDPVVVRSKQNVFTENRRAVIELSTAFGKVFYVAVGAAGVGGVVLSARPGDALQAGDHLGAFEFGGSTVVVLIPNPRQSKMWRPDLVAASLQGKESYVTVGEGVDV